MRRLIVSAVVVAGTLASPLAEAQRAEPELPRARPEAVGMSSAALGRIAPALRAYVESGRLAGIVAAIARRGKIVYLEAVGTMDSARSRPMRADAVFRIYSMTKPVTTVAALQLVERGKLRLDDPVSKYVPAFASAKVYSGGGARSATMRPVAHPITIAQLLTHTAGLSYGVFGNTPVDSIYRFARLDRPDWTIAQMADSLARLPLLSEPGTRWTYSLAIDVLGRVVEVASGKSLDRYFADEIFLPLGMQGTSFHATPAMTDRVAALFSGGRGGLRAGPATLAPIYLSGGKLLLGGQGLLSTVGDYLRFAQMLLNGGELDGRRILKRETVASMLRHQLPSGVTYYGRGYTFGLGGSLQVDSGGPLVSAPGTYQWSGIASTFFWIDPRAELVGMVWAQRIPSLGVLEADFKRLVYAAVSSR